MTHLTLVGHLVWESIGKLEAKLNQKVKYGEEFRRKLHMKKNIGKGWSKRSSSPKGHGSLGWLHAKLETKMSDSKDEEFYLRYYVGHEGKFGHEVCAARLFTVQFCIWALNVLLHMRGVCAHILHLWILMFCLKHSFSVEH